MHTTKMSLWKVSAIFCSIFLLTEAKTYSRRDVPADLCDPVVVNAVQCYCAKDQNAKQDENIRSADCYLTKPNIDSKDPIWEMFTIFQNTPKLSFTNSRGIPLNYIPSNAFKNTLNVVKLDIKFGQIEQINSFAFANISSVQEITLRNNQISKLASNALANHNSLKSLSFDENELQEINRNVFVNLPVLEKLFLTGNKLTTIHDRAFINLPNLLDLSLDRNNLFSLNNETFLGMKNLLKLDLSSNGLEVIGDNTFLPLSSLNSLYLEGNKIEMLDDKAFNGLSKLQSISLAHNKLANLNNANIFSGLKSLISLSLRGNQLHTVKAEVLAPILTNFYKATSSLDVEDNNFPCDCRLELFMSIMDTTNNNQLRISLENLKCNPDATLREQWKKLNDAEQSEDRVKSPEDDSQGQNNDYEYYDESQLNGKLFYIDIKDLLNCSSKQQKHIKEGERHTFTKVKGPSTIFTSSMGTVTESSRIVTESYARKLSTTEYVPHKITNKGVLDLSIEEAVKTTNAPRIASDNHINREETKPSYTTMKLATVSAKPSGSKNKFDDQDMASDEAKPDNIKAHRSIKYDNEIPAQSKYNNAFTFQSCNWLLTMIILRILFT